MPTSMKLLKVSKFCLEQWKELCETNREILKEESAQTGEKFRTSSGSYLEECFDEWRHSHASFLDLLHEIERTYRKYYCDDFYIQKGYKDTTINMSQTLIDKINELRKTCNKNRYHTITITNSLIFSSVVSYMQKEVYGSLL